MGNKIFKRSWWIENEKDIFKMDDAANYVKPLQTYKTYKGYAIPHNGLVIDLSRPVTHSCAGLNDDLKAAITEYKQQHPRAQFVVLGDRYRFVPCLEKMYLVSDVIKRELGSTTIKWKKQHITLHVSSYHDNIYRVSAYCSDGNHVKAVEADELLISKVAETIRLIYEKCGVDVSAIELGPDNKLHVKQ